MSSTETQAVKKASAKAVADAFAAPPPAKPRNPCKVGELIAALPETARASVNNAFAPDSGWKSTQIGQKLRELGYDVKDDNVSRHRRRLTKTGDHCECPVP